MDEPPFTVQFPKQSSWPMVVGLTLLSVHIITWYPGIFVVPLLPIPLATRAITAAAFVVIGEIAFWACLPFLGKEFIRRYKSKLNPRQWFKT